MKFERISIDPKIMTGKPCIKGTRITVELLLGRLGEGASMEWILAGYPHITREDILEAILYARAVVSLQEIEEVAA
ncbi:MAG: DUF433 domain-containing protein [Pedobacter sp.]|nr:DUF433 domain-containing protein [Chitinophagaceae bacterium]